MTLEDSENRHRDFCVRFKLLTSSVTDSPCKSRHGKTLSGAELEHKSMGRISKVFAGVGSGLGVGVGVIEMLLRGNTPQSSERRSLENAHLGNGRF